MVLKQEFNQQAAFQTRARVGAVISRDEDEQDRLLDV
jgi:hypothetical protein